MEIRTKWRRLEVVVLAALIGTLGSALPLRLLASTVPLITFVVTVAAGACVGVAIGAGALRPIVASLRHGPRARWRSLVAAALLLGVLLAGLRLCSSSWPLIIAFRYGNAGLQGWAAHTLWERGAEAIPGLLGTLESKDALVRQRAAKLLGEIEPPSVSALLQALEHADPSVREEAAKALGRIAAVRGIGAEGSRVATALARALRDEHHLEVGCTCDSRLRRLGYDAYGEVRRTAAMALEYVRPPEKEAVPILVEILRTGDSGARRLATGVLASMASVAEDATPVLVQALRDQDVAIRINVLNALRFIGPAARSAVPALIDALGQPDVWYRNAIADTLRHIDPAAAVARLVKDLEDPDPTVRMRSAWALGKLGSDAGDAIPALNRALHDPDEDIRQAAADALEQIEGVDGPSDPNSHGDRSGESERLSPEASDKREVPIPSLN